ncbi:MAG TPA: hypothetical protein ENG65_01875 [Candidatus Bathyarchaeota archaeon]|nr:hypothetical protein [Candidatus Bathyarchaeota archaeon]
MRIFSIYDNQKSIERVVNENKFSSILFINVHYYRPGENYSFESDEVDPLAYICIAIKEK